MALRIIPCILKQVNQVVALLHRHHKPVVGHRFSLAVRDEQHFYGAAIVGRPVAREISQYEVAEVTLSQAPAPPVSSPSISTVTAS